MSSPTTLIGSADYADALLTARRAKSVAIVLILVTVVTQLVLFVMIRHWDALHLPKPESATTDGKPALEVLTRRGPRTLAPGVKADPSAPTAAEVNEQELVQYGIGLMDFIGIIVPPILILDLLVILQIQLVSRTIGVRHTTSALVWAIPLAVLMFPWQAVLNNPAINFEPVNNQLGLKLPGVLYTWAEISHKDLGAHFDAAGDLKSAVLHWARFVGWPVVALGLILVVQIKSGRGLRLALGENRPTAEVVPTA